MVYLEVGLKCSLRRSGVTFHQKKGSPKNWLKVMGEAQSLGLITSATNVIGFGETNRQRVLHLEELRKLQDYSLENHGIGFTSFIAWLFS